ncbi:hypothetical protein PTKIN_Ptkin09bG0246900 [Pterospermum kingtungense]
MGVYLVVYYFILLLQAATSQEDQPAPRCNETCGGVTIPYPFGIKRGCYSYSFFRVDCKETRNGQKPFIHRINLELLNSSEPGLGYVTVNNPVTYFNCGSNSKGNNGTSTTATASSVNLKGTPFYFSGFFNSFGSVGCGSWATLFVNISNVAIAGCLQQRCGDPTSKSGGCWAEIPNIDLVSYTAAVR